MTDLPHAIARAIIATCMAILSAVSRLLDLAIRPAPPQEQDVLVGRDARLELLESGEWRQIPVEAWGGDVLLRPMPKEEAARFDPRPGQSLHDHITERFAPGRANQEVLLLGGPLHQRRVQVGPDCTTLIIQNHRYVQGLTGGTFVFAGPTTRRSAWRN